MPAKSIATLLLAFSCQALAQTAPPLSKAGDPLFAPLASSTPQTLEERFMDYAVISYGPRSLFNPAISAGITMLNPPKHYPRDWKDGPGAYGRIYGSKLASRASEQTARFLTAAVLHEDFRYRPSTSKDPIARIAHAFAFTFVDKSDSGGDRLAVANFAAAAASGFTPNLYLPRGYNTVSRAETRAAISFGGLVGKNLAREFAPDLARISRKLHVPFPHLPIPEWWTPR
jgi:hypothetical protein